MANMKPIAKFPRLTSPPNSKAFTPNNNWNHDITHSILGIRKQIIKKKVSWLFNKTDLSAGWVPYRVRFVHSSYLLYFWMDQIWKSKKRESVGVMRNRREFQYEQSKYVLNCLRYWVWWRDIIWDIALKKISRLADNRATPMCLNSTTVTDCNPNEWL